MNILKLLLPGLIVLAACSTPPKIPSPNRIPSQDRNRDRDYELARLYAPVFYFHPKEIYRPQSVQVILQHARLRQNIQPWLDVTLLNQVDSKTWLELESDPTFYLDVWYEDEDGSKYSNYTAHKAFYESQPSPADGGPPMVVYAHIVRDEDPKHVTIQYWALYFY